MRHMLGDYYSNIDPIPAFIIAGILVVVLIILVAVQHKREEVKRNRELNAPPTRTRATYVAAQSQAIYDYQEAEDAITRTNP